MRRELRTMLQFPLEVLVFALATVVALLIYPFMMLTIIVLIFVAPGQETLLQRILCLLLTPLLAFYIGFNPPHVFLKKIFKLEEFS